MTYKELKEKLEALTEEQLAQEVSVWEEEEPFKELKFIEAATEDFLYDDPQEGCFPRSEILSGDTDIDDWTVAVKEGTVYIWIERK